MATWNRIVCSAAAVQVPEVETHVHGGGKSSISLGFCNRQSPSKVKIQYRPFHTKESRKDWQGGK
jgi:hypothetical protein